MNQIPFNKSGTKTQNIMRKLLLFTIALFALNAAKAQGTPQDIRLVDLGLSVKWADRNIDAASETEKGGFYSWGETATKSTYSWKTYTHCNGTAATCRDIGSDISRNAKYDRAYASNSTLCLPTAEQWEELFSRCTWTETTVGGMKGYNVKGPSGNSIFLPFSGWTYDGKNYEIESNAYYWTSNNIDGDPSHAYGASVKSAQKPTICKLYRRTGVAIRAVENPESIVLVDLGLSVRWADRNIDAGTSADRGGLYAWGETATKSTYTWKTYTHCAGTAASCEIIGSDIRKNRNYDRAYDYNRAMCLPSEEQWEELVTKCTWTVATVDGVKGYNVKGPSGNSIFLPFSGCSYDGSNHGVGGYAYYWTSNYVLGEVSKARVAYIKSGEKATLTINNRRTGNAIRAVETQDDANGGEWFLVTDNNEFFEMSRVGMLVATDDNMLFSVLDNNGKILAEDVLQVRFVQGDPTPVREITAEGRSEGGILKGYVNNRLTLVGATGTVGIYNVSGVNVASATAEGGETTIDVSALPSGVYIVKCGKQSFKFNKK